MTKLGLRNVLVHHFRYKLVEDPFWSETKGLNLVFGEESPDIFLARKIAHSFLMGDEEPKKNSPA